MELLDQITKEVPLRLVSNAATKNRITPIKLKKVIQADYDIYNFKDSESGDSWLIGTDIYNDVALQYANAFKNGITACPEVLDIPGTLTDSNGKTKPVDTIGRGAFVACGRKSDNGNTKRLKVPRQIKVIKHYGLAFMHDLVSFEIEAGSELETIGDFGLSNIGYNTGQISSQRIATLILPSTLSSVFSSGITFCDLFDTIIYCGSYLLSNPCDIETAAPDTVVKVSILLITNLLCYNKKSLCTFNIYVVLNSLHLFSKKADALIFL